MSSPRSESGDDAEPGPPAPSSHPPTAQRALALLEVLLCSEFPTQFALAATFAAFGWRPRVNGALDLNYVAVLSLTDTVFLVGLILAILRARGEDASALFFGRRSVLAEARAGLPLLFAAFGVAILVMFLVQAAAPWLHTVPSNPLQGLVRTPGQAVLFAIVVIVAGGVREEIQRAFLLDRFERWLGGAKVGLVITSVAFGAGHIIQGADAALATSLLGALWGTVYLRRRSIAAPIVSHSGFNLVQVLQSLAQAP